MRHRQRLEARVVGHGIVSAAALDSRSVAAARGAAKAAPSGAPSRGQRGLGAAEEVGPLAQQLGRAPVGHIDHPPALAGAEQPGHPVEVLGRLAPGQDAPLEELAGDDLEDGLLRREPGAYGGRHGVTSADGLDGPSLM